MGFICANREQLMLFGYTLDDFVESSAKCRFITKVVGKLDLSELYADYSSQGGDAIDPEVLLATWFFAYSEGQTSTRKVEQACRRDMHYIYTSGNLKPDHTTLSRFRQRHLKRLPDYFVQIVRMAVEEGVSDFKLIGIDGSKLQAGCSPRQSRTPKALGDDLKKVRNQINEYLQRCELMDEEVDPSTDLPHLRDKISHLKKLEKTLQERKRQQEHRCAQLQPRHRKSHRINIVEPEARTMLLVNRQPGVPGYNAQISVDTQSHLIVAADVTDERTDQKQFKQQHQQAEDNLGNDSNRQYVADSGYHSLDQLEYVKENEVDAVIADPNPNQREESTASEHRKTDYFTRGQYRYDSENDLYTCPAGENLEYWYTETQRGRRRRVYGGMACVGCALRSQCIRSKNPKRKRTIVRDTQEHLAENMLKKSRSPEGRHRMILRKETVEPVFGNLKSNLGFRRFRLRGMDKVKNEFLLMCIGHNLSKLHRLIKGPKQPIDRLFRTLYSMSPSLLKTFRLWTTNFLLNNAGSIQIVIR